MLLGYGAKVGLGNMRVKAENRMVTHPLFYVSFLLMNWNNEIYFVESYCSFIEKLI